jgi:hypothetical protein
MIRATIVDEGPPTCITIWRGGVGKEEWLLLLTGSALTPSLPHSLFLTPFFLFPSGHPAGSCPRRSRAGQACPPGTGNAGSQIRDQRHGDLI